MADLINEKNVLPVDNNTDDSDIMELRDLLVKLGFNVDINLKDLENICYEKFPPESRFDLLQDVMFRIHPEKEFWVAKNETDTNSKILQVSSWFGLASSDDIVLGGGTRAEQKRFWKLALHTAVQLENPKSFKPVDIGLMKQLDFIIINSSILDEVISDSKGVEATGNNGGMNIVLDLMERIEAEAVTIEENIGDERQKHEKTDGYKSSKIIKRKQQLASSLKSVHKNISALLDKYTVLCPCPAATSASSHIDNENRKLLCKQLEETFTRVVSVQTKLESLSLQSA